MVSRPGNSAGVGAGAGAAAAVAGLVGQTNTAKNRSDAKRRIKLLLDSPEARAVQGWGGPPWPDWTGGARSAALNRTTVPEAAWVFTQS
jgi:hypothetical protein